MVQRFMEVSDARWGLPLALRPRLGRVGGGLRPPLDDRSRRGGRLGRRRARAGGAGRRGGSRPWPRRPRWCWSWTTSSSSTWSWTRRSWWSSSRGREVVLGGIAEVLGVAVLHGRRHVALPDLGGEAAARDAVHRRRAPGGRPTPRRRSPARTRRTRRRRCSWVVPVLPAAGRPMSAAVPVPDSMTPRRACVTVRATSGSTASSSGSGTVGLPEQVAVVVLDAD